MTEIFRLTEMKNQTGSAGVISEYRSEYLLNGQKSKEDSDVTDKDGKKNTKTATYTYDLIGRLTKETRTGSEDISYTYDNSNNRKEMKKGNKVTAYKYNKNDELLRTDTLNTSTEEDSIVIYKNDKNGNQLATVNRYEIPSDPKYSTYIDIDVTLGDNRLNENVVNHYNALNQLTQTLTENYKVSFAYDAEGLRTSKTVNGEKTVFVWDGDQLVLELTESGKVRKRYIRGNDLVYADKGTDTEKQYYVTDPHGNVVQTVDESGKVTKAYEYDSFGNEVKPDSKDDNPFRYCGEYYDHETGEVYLRARYYQPAVGRFLTRDSYTGQEDEPESLHLYTYCGNDGVNAWDPSGHDAVSAFYDAEELARELSQMDGPLPIGDIAGEIILTGAAIWVLGEAIDEWINEEDSDQTIAEPLPRRLTKEERARLREQHAIMKAAQKILQRTKNKKKKYFEMNVSKLSVMRSTIVTIGRQITRPKAVKRLENGKSVVTWFRYNAKKIAVMAGKGKFLWHNNTMKSGRAKKEKILLFDHYHPLPNTKAHSAYVFG